MFEILEHTIIDSIKLLPFLFIAFLIIEAMEHKLNDKSKKIIESSGKFGPIIGGILGVFPQCGFSVLATNLYVTRIISLGTLIAIYLSTSDEMLPILIAHKADISIILKLVGIKLFIGIICGIIIDMVLKKQNNTNYHICEEEHCDCEHGILKSSLVHTFKTFTFILIITFILNIFIHSLGEDFLKNILAEAKFLTPFVSSLIGLIPNCASSIIISELYLNEVLSLAGVISGLLTGSGVAILVLFKTNKNIKENFQIISLLYGIGVTSGVIIELLSMI